MYCETTLTEILAVKALKIPIKMFVDLTTILYGIKKDPVSNSLRERMNHDRRDLRINGAQYNSVLAHYAEQIKNVSIQERASNFNTHHYADNDVYSFQP